MGNVCGSAPMMPYQPEPEPLMPPKSPSWKLPSFPAPVLPSLTQQNKIIIASTRYVDDEEEKQKTKKCVLNGSGEALSVVFDDGQLLEDFVPEVKKLFSLALTITSLEIHTANLDVEADFLHTFLDTLPSHGELKAFSLVTARDTPLVYSAISGLLYRNPGLKALRLWGIDLTPAGSGNQYYPQCKLVRVDLSQCKMLPQHLDNLLGSSKDSLLCLKFDKLIGLSGSHMARAVNNYGQKVQMLTILLPDYSESEMDHRASYLVGDTASRFPANLKYLHLAGLAASDNLFTVTPTAGGSAPDEASHSQSDTVPQTHLSSLVALRLDNCPRLTVNALFAAVRQKTLANLLRLHVYWLENEDAYNDIELWKTFAASEDIEIKDEEEGLLFVTAMKAAPKLPPPTTQSSGPEPTPAEQAAIIQQKALQVQALQQQAAYPPPLSQSVDRPGFLGQAQIYPTQPPLVMPQAPQSAPQPSLPPPVHFADVRSGDKIQYLDRPSDANHRGPGRSASPMGRSGRASPYRRQRGTSRRHRRRRSDSDSDTSSSDGSSDESSEDSSDTDYDDHYRPPSHRSRSPAGRSYAGTGRRHR